MLKRVPLRAFARVAFGAMLGFAAAATPAASEAQAPAAGKKPNILVIFGDDIGQTNVSAYTMGLMGYRTPNIDRIAREGMIFTDYYAEQSCTAGRSSFITGQCTFRTGLEQGRRPGVAGRPAEGRPDDRRAAQAATATPPASSARTTSATGTSSCPPSTGSTSSSATSTTSTPRRSPSSGRTRATPSSSEMFGPRGVLQCKATDKDDPTVDPRFGRVGKQTIEDTGPLTKKRMETIDDETSDAAVDYIKRQAAAGKPFFCWYNSTRMHLRTHVAAERRSPPGLTARTEYADGMVEHDGHVGKLLKALDDLGIADDTIVLYTTDNGPHMNTWPDGAMTPFRSEKNTNWEGAFRVPCMIRWPGKIKAGSVSNEIVSGHDWLPTLLAAAGEPDIKEKLLKGHEAAGKTFKVHLDGFNQLPYLTGQVEQEPAAGVLLLQRRRRPRRALRSRTGRSCSWSSGRPAPCGSGPSRSPRSGCPSSSTSGPTRTSGPTSPPTPTTTGSSPSHT